MYKIQYLNRFKKDFKIIQSRQNFKIEHLDTVVNLLMNGRKLPKKYKLHKLKGELKDFFECHLKPDILLIFRVDTNKSIIELFRLGSHSDLF